MLILAGSVLIAVLFMLSAFWSGSETALTSLSKYRIKKIIALKKSLAVALMQWLKAPYYYLTTILVGNTVTNMLLSFIATLVVLEVFSPFKLFSKYPGKEVLEFITWLAVTFGLLILGEVTPKIFSRHFPERVTMFSLPILSKIMAFTRPLAFPVVRIMRVFFPKTDLIPVSRLKSLSLEEVRDLINEANTTGTLGKETTQMLESVLKLNNLQIDKIMTPLAKVEMVNLEQEEDLILDLISETGQSRVPVYYGAVDKIKGFVHAKDLLWAWENNKGKFSEDLIRSPYFVSNDKSIYELLKEFQSGKSHLAFVVDAAGKTVGIVTLEDILEEIVGEILDEYDVDGNI